jgi:hypothetical protein
MLSLGWSEKVETGGVEGEGIGVQRDSRGEEDQPEGPSSKRTDSPLPLSSPSPLHSPLHSLTVRWDLAR